MSAMKHGLARIGAGWRWGGLVALAVLGVLLVWFFFLRSTSPQAQPAKPLPRPALGKVLNYPDYVAGIDKALADVHRAQSASGQDRNQAVQSAIKGLQDIEGADVSPQGSTSAYSEVDNTAVTEELRKDKPNLDAASASLSALSQRLHGGADTYLPGTLNGGQADTQLRQVLSDPTFNYEKDLSPLQRLVRWLESLTGQADPGDTLWRWFIALAAALASGILTFLVTERLGSRWLRLGLSVTAGLAVGALFYAGLNAIDVTLEALGLVGLIVAVIAVALIFSVVGRAAGPSSRPKAISELAAILGMHAAEARKKAEEAAAEGDYRSAIRYRCLALLLALDEAGKLTFDRAATNREYLFRAHGLLHDELQPLLARFDEVWYGNLPAGEQEWQEYKAHAANVEGMTQTSERSAA